MGDGQKSDNIGHDGDDDNARPLRASAVPSIAGAKMAMDSCGCRCGAQHCEISRNRRTCNPLLPTDVITRSINPCVNRPQQAPRKPTQNRPARAREHPSSTKRAHTQKHAMHAEYDALTRPAKDGTKVAYTRQRKCARRKKHTALDALEVTMARCRGEAPGPNAEGKVSKHASNYKRAERGRNPSSTHHGATVIGVRTCLRAAPEGIACKKSANLSHGYHGTDEAHKDARERRRIGDIAEPRSNKLDHGDGQSRACQSCSRISPPRHRCGDNIVDTRSDVLAYGLKFGREFGMATSIISKVCSGI